MCSLHVSFMYDYRYERRVFLPVEQKPPNYAEKTINYHPRTLINRSLSCDTPVERQYIPKIRKRLEFMGPIPLIEVERSR